MRLSILLIIFVNCVSAAAQERDDPSLFEIPAIESSWDDLTDGVKTPEE